VAYVNLAQVQSWLQQDKYDLLPDGIAAEQEGLAANRILATLEQRYNTSTWTDSTNTPAMVSQMIAMLVASYTLRKAVSQDDGIATYADWLEGRVDALLAGLVDGSIDLPGIEPDPNSPGGASVGFFPTEAATHLWMEDPHAEGGAARWFTMQQVF
jgi:hypothetical protein